MSRRPKGDLVAWWKASDESRGDIHFAWDKHPPDGSLLYSVFSARRLEPGLGKTWPGDRACCGQHVFSPSFIEELEKRGYDLRTLRFSISRKRAD